MNDEIQHFQELAEAIKMIEKNTGTSLQKIEVA